MVIHDDYVIGRAVHKAKKTIPPEIRIALALNDDSTA